MVSLYVIKRFQKFENIMDYIDGVTLNKLNTPEIMNVVNIDDYIKIPENYEHDTYINIDIPDDFIK